MHRIVSTKMALYQNIYRIESVRLREWDYTNAAWYYVTINTKNHLPYFGEVVDSIMILNVIGKILQEEWLNTEIIRKGIELDYYQIMPNHLHGIIIFNGIVNTKRFTSSPTLKPNSLGSIIGQFKSVCTKRIHDSGCKQYAWQTRYYEHIIRNERELYKIRKYILENPRRWEIEKENIEDIEL
jgi:putative transposase